MAEERRIVVEPLGAIVEEIAAFGIILVISAKRLSVFGIIEPGFDGCGGCGI